MQIVEPFLSCIRRDPRGREFPGYRDRRIRIRRIEPLLIIQIGRPRPAPEPMLLLHHRDPPAFRRYAPGNKMTPQQGMGQYRFTASGGADQRPLLAAADGPVQPIQHFHPAHLYRDLLQGQKDLSHAANVCRKIGPGCDGPQNRTVGPMAEGPSLEISDKGRFFSAGPKDGYPQL